MPQLAKSLLLKLEGLNGASSTCCALSPGLRGLRQEEPCALLVIQPVL